MRNDAQLVNIPSSDYTDLSLKERVAGRPQAHVMTQTVRRAGDRPAPTRLLPPTDRSSSSTVHPTSDRCQTPSALPATSQMLALFKLMYAVCALALLAAARPAPGLDAAATDGRVELATPALVDGQSTLSICPTWKVRCVKDSRWPSGIVGDIGPQPFCFQFPRCYQCEEQANSDEVRRHQSAPLPARSIADALHLGPALRSATSASSSARGRAMRFPPFPFEAPTAVPPVVHLACRTISVATLHIRSAPVRHRDDSSGQRRLSHTPCIALIS
jgi:hypothetical protein